MNRPSRPSARVTRLTPPGSTLARASGAPIHIGAEVTDGETVTLATPGGVPGAVTLDARGVALVIRTVALVASEPVSVAVAVDPPPVAAQPSRSSRRSLPIVKPILDDSTTSGEEPTR